MNLSEISVVLDINHLSSRFWGIKTAIIFTSAIVILESEPYFCRPF